MLPGNGLGAVFPWGACEVLGSQRLTPPPLMTRQPHPTPASDSSKWLTLEACLMSNMTLPTLVLAGERDNPEGHRICQPSVPQRPGHCGKAVHRLGGLLHRPLGPLLRAPCSPVVCRTSNTPLCLCRKGWDGGSRQALISAAHPKDHSQVPRPPVQQTGSASC